MLRKTLVIALIALIVSACSSSKQVAVSQSADLRINESTDVRSRDSVVVAVHDTIMETTTINVQTSEAGDTLRLVQITDRTRASNRVAVKDKEVRTVVKHDTVYIAERDSLRVTGYGLEGSDASPVSSKLSAVSHILKWIFWIIVGLIAYKLTAYWLRGL